MEKNRRHQENTDAEETMFFRAADAGKPTDQYDTQQLEKDKMRRPTSQSPYRENTYGQNGYAGHYSNADGSYRYGYDGYGRQNGSVPNGQYSNRKVDYTPGNSYRNSPGQRQGGSYSRQGGYVPGGRTQGQNGYRSQNPERYRRPDGSSSYHSHQGYTPQGGNYRYPAGERRPPQRVPQQRRSAGTAQPQWDNKVSNGHNRVPQKRSRRSSVFGRIVKSILCVVIGIFLLYSVIAMIGIVSMNRVETGDRGYTSGSLNASYVKNVLVIGTDTRDPEVERGRSDSMILVSMNAKTNEIYMTSFMRDAYVEIPGNGSGKLNAAYSYGGPELLMDTIESNYQVHIDDYVMVTFSATAAMIDAVGGVELTISDDEAQAVNEILISEVNEIMGDDREDDLLEGGGTLTLNGKQALSYSRIRYVGNADFERTERQRTVMQQVMEKVKKNPFRLISVCLSALPEMTTNLSVGSLYGYAVTTPIKLLTYDVEQQRMPADGMYSGADIGGESVLQVDFDAAQQLLTDTVFAEK